MDLEDPRYAYMFGFLQADGHLAPGTGRKGRLSVEIGVRDIAILREFQQLTPYSSSITERVRSTNFAERHHSATWTLCALEARTRLNGLGLPYGRKSKRITPPRVEFSRRDYLRGIIDADGSIGHTGQGLPFVSLTTASAAVGAYLCRYAKVVTGAARQIGRNARDGVYNVVHTKEAAVQPAEHLYYPGCLSLARKQDGGHVAGLLGAPGDDARASARPPLEAVGGPRPAGSGRRHRVSRRAGPQQGLLFGTPLAAEDRTGPAPRGRSTRHVDTASTGEGHAAPGDDAPHLSP